MEPQVADWSPAEDSRMLGDFVFHRSGNRESACERADLNKRHQLEDSARGLDGNQQRIAGGQVFFGQGVDF